MQHISSTVCYSKYQESKTLAQNINRKRKAEMSCPVIPKCWENMKIPDEFKKTSDGKPFCIMEECMPGKSR